jgi:hypothetical protein
MIMNYPEIVSECLWLGPLLAVIVFRHILAVTLIYTLILFISLVGCIYDLVQFFLIGTGAIPTFGWPGFVLFLLGIVSLPASLIKIVFHR